MLFRETLKRPIGLRVRGGLLFALPSLPSKSFANPCSVLHELPHKPAIGLSFPLRFPEAPVAWFPLELSGLLSLSRGIGLPPRLSKGLGSGLAALLVGPLLVTLSSVSLLSSPSMSLNPEISLRLRGRREDEDAGVELVRTSLGCIAGNLGYSLEIACENRFEHLIGREWAALVASSACYRIDRLREEQNSGMCYSVC